MPDFSQNSIFTLGKYLSWIWYLHTQTLGALVLTITPSQSACWQMITLLTAKVVSNSRTQHMHMGR